MSAESPGYAALLADGRFSSLLAISYIGMFNATVVSPALPAIAAAFEVTDAEIGLVMSVYTLPGIALVLVLGAIADIYGRRRVLLLSLLLFGAGGTAIAFVGSFESLLVLRVVQGVGGAVIMPLTAAVIGDLYTGVAGSTAHGLRASGNGVSMLVMPAVVGVLVGVSWRYAFLLYAVVFVVLVAGYALLPAQRGRANTQPRVTDTLRAYGASAVAELRAPEHAVLVLGGLVRGFAIFAILTFVPLFAARSFAATSVAIGLIIAMRGAARIAVAPLTGHVMARVSYRTALTVAVVVTAASALAIPFVSGVVGLGIGVALYSVGDSLFFPVQQDALTSLPSEDHRAGVVSAASFLRKVGTTTSPILFGAVLAVAGFTPIFVATGVVLLAYAAVVAWYL